MKKLERREFVDGIKKIIKGWPSLPISADKIAEVASELNGRKISRQNIEYDPTNEIRPLIKKKRQELKERKKNKAPKEYSSFTGARLILDTKTAQLDALKEKLKELQLVHFNLMYCYLENAKQKKGFYPNEKLEDEEVKGSKNKGIIPFKSK